jgi:hypothetical protein
MQDRRGSPVWRSLAVAFGDGLAFGVGMKLTQNAVRRPAAPAHPAPVEGLMERLNAIEDRISQIERSPAAIPAMPPAAAAPFDQKVLEAVVNALDARLKEQEGQVERRLTELEAKLAIELKTLQQQDHSIASAMQGRIEELQAQFDGQLNAIRQTENGIRGAVRKEISSLIDEAAARQTVAIEAISERAAGRFNAEVAAIRESEAAHRAALREELTAMYREFSLEVENELEQRIARDLSGQMAQAAATQAAAIEQELEGRDREIAALRQRVAAGERNVFEMIRAIGHLCQTVAASHAVGAAEPPVAAPSETVDSSEPASPPDAELAAEAPLPGFAQARPPARLLTIPLVSSLALVVTAGAAILLRL